MFRMWNDLMKQNDFKITKTGWNHKVTESLFIAMKWIFERVGVKLHRQEEGGVTKEKLGGILPRWLDVILPFSGGLTKKERPSSLL